MAIQRYPQEWSEWGEWLSRGLHGRCRHRLAILLAGVLFAQGRRTVASWLRRPASPTSSRHTIISSPAWDAIPDGLPGDCFASFSRRVPIGPRVVFALDDTPTKRYGPQVEGAGIPEFSQVF